MIIKPIKNIIAEKRLRKAKDLAFEIKKGLKSDKNTEYIQGSLAVAEKLEAKSRKERILNKLYGSLIAVGTVIISIPIMNYCPPCATALLKYIPELITLILG